MCKPLSIKIFIYAVILRHSLISSISREYLLIDWYQVGFLVRCFNYFYKARFNFFDEGGPCLMETSANQCTAFYMIRISVMKELRNVILICIEYSPKYWSKIFFMQNSSSVLLICGIYYKYAQIYPLLGPIFFSKSIGF